MKTPAGLAIMIAAIVVLSAPPLLPQDAGAPAAVAGFSPDEEAAFAAREADAPGLAEFEAGHGGELLLLPVLLVAAFLGWMVDWMCGC